MKNLFISIVKALSRLTYKAIGQRLLNYEKSFYSCQFEFIGLKKSGVSKGNTLSRLTSKPI
jgi:hypothetical protein